MLLIRRFEEKAGQMYGMGLIGGFCHLYIGQEAVVVGMQMALKKGDQVITGYRDHGHMLACGMDPKGVMAELTGRRGGYSKGKGGSMHMFCGRRTSSAATASSARRCRSAPASPSPTAIAATTIVSLTYFGDGAANQGQVYESFNMAELWKLPVIYIIENNRYAMGTSVTRASAKTDFSKRGASFNIPGRAGRRHGRARGEGRRRQGGQMVPRGQGPVHPGDADLPLSRPLDVRPGQIPHPRRSREGAHEHDPIEQVRHRCSRKKWASEDELKKIDAKVREIVNEAAEFATTIPSPIRPSSTPTSIAERAS